MVVETAVDDDVEDVFVPYGGGWVQGSETLEAHGKIPRAALDLGIALSQIEGAIAYDVMLRQHRPRGINAGNATRAS